MSNEKTLAHTASLTAYLSLVAYLWPWLSLQAFATLLPLSMFLSVRWRGRVAVLWSKLTAHLHFIHTQLLLSLLFIGVLCPSALIYRLFNRDPLKLRRSKFNTYYQARYWEYSSRDFKRMW